MSERNHTGMGKSSWAFGRVVRNSSRQLSEEWRRTPRGDLIRAGRILLVGAALCVGWSAAVSIMGSWLEPQGMGDWDERALRWIEERGPLGFTGAIMAESPGNASYLFPLTTAVAILLAARGRALAGLAVMIAYWGARPLIGIGWSVWDRARPDLIAGGVAAPELHSFPSGHATLSTAAYSFLAYLWIRASDSAWEKATAVALAFAWVLYVSYGRVRLGAHWPSDIPAGMAVGLAWSIVVILALRAAEAGRRDR